MVATSYELGFPFMAGSGLSVSWRMPSSDLPYGAHVEESLVIGGGWLDGGVREAAHACFHSLLHSPPPCFLVLCPSVSPATDLAL